MKYLPVALALLLASCQFPLRANAEPLSRDPRTYAEWVEDLTPPPEYRAFTGRVIENRARDMQDMADLCYPNPDGPRALGCAIRFHHPVTGEWKCYIYIAPDSELRKWYVTADQIRQHELGHCAGWRHAGDNGSHNKD
jgi:hypothetical protein